MGTLRVGPVGPYPPFVGGGAGLDADLAEALGTPLGDDVVVASVGDVADGLDRLRAGDHDVLLGGLTVTAEHDVAFLPPYVITGEGSRSTPAGCLVSGRRPTSAG